MDQTLVQALLSPGALLTINVTLFICAVLVMFMQPGFMLLEAGSVSRKNAINNIFKNFLDFCMCGLMFWWIGYDILSGESHVTTLMLAIGLANEAPPAIEGGILPSEPILIFFQLVFASTAITVTSGTVTGRIRPFHYLFYSVFFAGIIYPLVAFTVWNPMGLLAGVFTDFAGAMVVHGLGAFAGLAGALMLGPRIGFFRYGAEEYGAEVVDELADSHQPHSVPLAALGVFLLWIGWFGFNAGTHFGAGLEPFGDLEGGDLLAPIHAIFDTFSQIIANTVLAPAAAAFFVTSLLLIRQEELDMQKILNGAIAGLVAITASCHIASELGAVIIGAIAGIVLVYSFDVIDMLRIDDPVGAFPAHGVSGVLGVVAVAFFPGEGQSFVNLFFAQLFGAVLIAGFSFGCAFAVFSLSKLVMVGLYKVGILSDMEPGFGDNLLRVVPEVELEGLDLHLHGRDAYNIYDVD